MLSLFTRSAHKPPEIAIDLGTANTRVMARGSGVLFDQPSICCFVDDGAHPRLIAVGDEAGKMQARTSGALKVRQPLARGVLQDLGAARELLKFAVRSSTGGQSISGPRAIIGVPADATNAECAALQTAATDAGLRKVRLIREPLAAAFGAQLPVDEPTGSMIVECGAGTTEVAVFALGGFCLTRSVRGGGLALNGAIASHIQMHHQFLIGDPSAEQFKRELLEVLDGPDPDDCPIKVKGRSLKDGRPGSLTMTAGEFRPVVARHAGQIVQLVRQILHETPPQLSDDIFTGGIVLTGGSARRLIADAINADTGLKVRIADDREHCVALGLQSMLES